MSEIAKICSWQSTKIYEELLLRNGSYQESIKTLLNISRVMPDIEDILTNSATSPKDFTLHNAAHSFRVAEKMWEIIPVETKKVLTEYELGFLLLSAYLHDIGMSPDFVTVNNHKEYITGSNKTLLQDEEIDNFQEWLDNNDKVKAINIRHENVDDPKQLNYILNYYIRYRHNDWSGQWIEKNIANQTLKDYSDWSDDLIKLCKSHHFGIEELLKDSFDFKPIQNTHVHLRYLSMILRVADVMENDPERTPDVIFQHRSIDPYSVVYWIKDHRYSLNINETKIGIHARPDRAYLHKAIIDTADMIETELKVCDALKIQKPLNIQPYSNDVKYQWEFEAVVNKDIKPKDRAYEYIQGGFRPNTAKILEILGGNQLYGNSIWAFRETIQNAFDAINERIAYNIINEGRDHKIFIGKFGELYSLNISVEREDDEVWLICKDAGVGMTKAIIEKFFLESGSSRRHEIKELERRCAEQGFEFQRIGQFGIGVLSYFMIADKILLRTRREQVTGYRDEDSIAWQFIINGTHDFGELVRYEKHFRGTELRLRLNNNIVSDIDAWDEKFSLFLKEGISKTPCEIFYTSALNAKNDIHIRHGWTKNKQDVINSILKTYDEDTQPKNNDNSYSLYSSEQLRSIEENLILVEETRKNIEEVIDVLYDEGNIEGKGRYRIFIPYFKLSKGNSLIYLKETLYEDHTSISRLGSGFSWLPYFKDINFSVKGISINPTFSEKVLAERNNKLNFSNVFVNFDFEHIGDGDIGVSRHSFTLADENVKIYSLVNEAITQLIERSKIFNNAYNSLNARFTGHNVFDNQYWIDGDAFWDKNCDWRQVQFPACSDESFNRFYYENAQYQGSELFFLKSIHDYKSESVKRPNKWNSTANVKFRLGMQVDNSILGSTYRFLPVMVGCDDFQNSYIKRMEFPSAMKDIALLFSERHVIKTDESLFLNTENPLCNLYSDQIFEKFRNPNIDIGIDKLKTAAEAFCFLLNLIKKYSDNSWTGICENKNELIEYIFDYLAITELRILNDSNLTIYHKKGILYYSSKADLNVHVNPAEHEDYIITVKLNSRYNW